MGTKLGAFGGYANLAPGIFTIVIPYVVVASGIGSAYALWAALLFVGARGGATNCA